MAILVLPMEMIPIVKNCESQSICAVVLHLGFSVSFCGHSAGFGGRDPKNAIYDLFVRSFCGHSAVVLHLAFSVFFCGHFAGFGVLPVKNPIYDLFLRSRCGRFAVILRSFCGRFAVFPQSGVRSGCGRSAVVLRFFSHVPFC